MAEEKRGFPMPHNVIIEDRKSVAVTGVSDIDSFDEEQVVLLTPEGEMTIKGFDLHINRLSVETGEMTVEGEIVSITYSDAPRAQGGGSFFSRIFR